MIFGIILVFNNFLKEVVLVILRFFLLLLPYYYYYLHFSNAYIMKTKQDIKKIYSQKVWNYLNAALNVVFMISFHRVFVTSTKDDLNLCSRFLKTGSSYFHENFFQDTLDI